MSLEMVKLEILHWRKQYDKSQKEIIYYNGEWFNEKDNSNKSTVGYPFSSYIVPYLIGNDAEFAELYDNAAIYLDRKYKRAKFFENSCRSAKELAELLAGENGEGCDVNPVISEDSNESSTL